MVSPLSKPPFLFRVSPPRAKHLLVVNRGPGAVHIPREGDAWDLLEIYFAPSEIAGIVQDPSLSAADHVVFESDRQWRKYRVMKKVFETTTLIDAYESVMFADDDLIPVGCSISDMFALFAKTGCRVGQPALTQDSYYYWFTTLKNNNFLWRKTNFAEIMCPILRQDAIRDYLPMFDAIPTNFGLDFYWGYHEWMSGVGLAVLDSTPMRHCRPVGGGTAYEGMGDPHAQFVGFMEKSGTPFYSHLCLGGTIDPALSPDQINACLRIGLAITGYDDAYLKDPKFLTSYVKREVEALHEKGSLLSQTAVG